MALQLQLRADSWIFLQMVRPASYSLIEFPFDGRHLSALELAESDGMPAFGSADTA